MASCIPWGRGQAPPPPSVPTRPASASLSLGRCLRRPRPCTRERTRPFPAPPPPAGRAPWGTRQAQSPHAGGPTSRPLQQVRVPTAARGAPRPPPPAAPTQPQRPAPEPAPRLLSSHRSLAPRAAPSPRPGRGSRAGQRSSRPQARRRREQWALPALPAPERALFLPSRPSASISRRAPASQSPGGSRERPDLSALSEVPGVGVWARADPGIRRASRCAQLPAAPHPTPGPRRSPRQNPHPGYPTPLPLGTHRGSGPQRCSGQTASHLLSPHLSSCRLPRAPSDAGRACQDHSTTEVSTSPRFSR